MTYRALSTIKDKDTSIGNTDTTTGPSEKELTENSGSVKYEDVISMGNLEEALRSCKDSAPGTDGILKGNITDKSLKALHDSLKKQS
jgi:hypothetical protein